jgi:hypothetical protein
MAVGFNLVIVLVVGIGLGGLSRTFRLGGESADVLQSRSLGHLGDAWRGRRVTVNVAVNVAV